MPIYVKKTAMEELSFMSLKAICHMLYLDAFNGGKNGFIK